MKKLALLLAVALAFLCGWASADVGKGDRSEEVRYLQWLLKQTGWLGDNPDGIFGNHTEQAVIDCQTSKGLEATGIADAALMEALERDRVTADKQAHGQDYYEPYPGDYAPDWDFDPAAPAHCRTAAMGNMLYRNSCERHAALLAQEYALTFDGAPADFSEAAALWKEDIADQFDEWASGASATDRKAVEAARAAWDACFAAQEEALKAAQADLTQARREAVRMLKGFAGALCELRSGDAPAAGADALTAEGEAAPGDACRAWTLNGSTEFYTGCAEHGALMARESAWPDAERLEALKAATDGWEAALAALYECWAEDTDAARAAEDAFDRALDALDAALAGSECAPFARLRVVQLECARLCALLNAEE